MEETLSDPQRLSGFYDAHPHGILWARPVFKDGAAAPADFEFAYCNEEGSKPLGMRPEELRSLLLSNITALTGEVRRKVLLEMSRVYQAGQRSETTILYPLNDRYYKVFCIPFHGGLLNILQDVTELNHALREQERQRDLAGNLLESSPGGAFIARPRQEGDGKVTDFVVQHVNPAFARLLSLTGEQLPEQFFLSGLRITRQKSVLNMHRRVFQTGRSESMDIQLKEGNPQSWYKISTVKLGDSIVTTFADISTKKREMLQVEEQLSLLVNIIRHSSSGIAVSETVLDRLGQVTDLRALMVNDIATSLIGISKEAYLARPLTQVVPSNWKSFFLKRCIRVLKTGKPRHTVLFWELTQKWLEITIYRMSDTRLIAIIMDISTLKAAQLDLQHSVKELQRSNTSLEELAYAASHDLHEPLRKIQYFSERLKKGLTTVPEAESIRMLERMVVAATWMRRVIDDLWMYTKVSAKPDLKNRVNLNDLMKEVLHELSPDIRQSGARIEVESLPCIHGDEYQLRQLFQNLISNALRFSKAGTAPEITIQSKTLTEKEAMSCSLPGNGRHLYCQIEVSDNGIGFEQEHAEKIFQIFQRLHRRQEYEGTGVGLAIAQKVVANHHGFIKAVSQLGKGTIFRLMLPA